MDLLAADLLGAVGTNRGRRVVIDEEDVGTRDGDERESLEGAYPRPVAQGAILLPLFLRVRVVRYVEGCAT